MIFDKNTIKVCDENSHSASERRKKRNILVQPQMSTICIDLTKEDSTVIDLTKEADDEEEIIIVKPTKPSKRRRIERTTSDEKEQWSCSVCLDTRLVDLVALPCGHLYHNICIQAALKSASLCPICRIKVSKKRKLQQIYL